MIDSTLASRNHRVTTEPHLMHCSQVKDTKTGSKRTKYQSFKNFKRSLNRPGDFPETLKI